MDQYPALAVCVVVVFLNLWFNESSGTELLLGLPRVPGGWDLHFCNILLVSLLQAISIKHQLKYLKFEIIPSSGLTDQCLAGTTL